MSDWRVGLLWIAAQGLTVAMLGYLFSLGSHPAFAEAERTLLRLLTTL